MSNSPPPFGGPNQPVPVQGPVPTTPRAPKTTRADRVAQESAELAQQRWRALMDAAHKSAQAAWDSGRSHHTVVARLEYAEGSPGDDAAGMLQVVTRIGWGLFSTDLASAVRLVIPGGMASWGGIGVVGKDQYVNDLIAVYTFARPDPLASPSP